MNTVIIDVETSKIKPFMAALRKLKSSVSVEDGGAYREDSSYSQVHYTGEMDENGIDEWACRVKAGAGFIGAVNVKEEQAPATPAEAEETRAFVFPTAVEPVKTSAMGKPVPNGVLFSSLKLGQMFMSPDVNGVWTKVNKTYGNLLGFAKYWQQFDNDEYVILVPSNKIEKPVTQSRNKREGKYAGKAAECRIDVSSGDVFTSPVKHWRTGPKSSYASLKDTAKFYKMING